MCVILIKPNGKTVSEQVLDECWLRNGQGAGFVFIPDKIKDPIQSEKGIMTLPELKEKVTRFTNKYGKLIIHFRIQSRGGISNSLTHPFSCNYKDKQRFLFHNGTVRLFNPPNGMSDSSVLAQHLSVLDDEDAQKLLDKLTKEGYGRFVLVSGREVFKHFDNEAATEDGIWFSNTKHKTHKGPAPTVGDGAYDYSDADWEALYTDGNDHWQSRNRRQAWDSIPPNKPKSSPPPIISNIKLTQEETGKLINLAAMQVAIANGVAESDLSSYCAEIIIDHGLNDLDEEDLLILHRFRTNENPLLAYYEYKLK